MSYASFAGCSSITVQLNQTAGSSQSHKHIIIQWQPEESIRPRINVVSKTILALTAGATFPKR